MAYRYLIYSTGTTYSSTILRESATDNPGVNEASYYTDFIIPEIQPLYLWRVNNVTIPTNVIPNTDANISAYESSTAPPSAPDDLVTYGELTGATENKIDKVSGATDNIAIFDVNGGLQDGGYTIPELTGLTSTKLDTLVFNAYTGAAQPIINAALTGVTNLGTGTTFGSTSSRNITLKSISVLGGLSLSGDANNLIISGQTDGGGTLTGATNGLHVEGKNVVLGGLLTGTTSILVLQGDNFQVVDGGQTLGGLKVYGFGGVSMGDFCGGGNHLLEVGDNVTSSVQSNSGQTNCTYIQHDYASMQIMGLKDAGDSCAGYCVCNFTNMGASMFANCDTTNECAAIKIQPGSISVAGSKSGGTFAGIVYDGDYETNFAARSLVTKQYVTGLTTNLLSVSTITGYTASTDQRLEGIESDVVYLSGQTDTKLAISDFDTYSGLTDTRISDIETDITTLYNESLINITGATNGLSKVGGKVAKLGGALTENTVLSGTSYNFTVNTNNITLQSVDGISIIDANGAGGVNIESDGGTISLIGNDSVGTEKTKIEINDALLRVTDSRATKVGLVYAADYSADFTNESLVTKRYVDYVATGLIPKASVKVATTGNIDLTGGTFGGTIDGETVLDGWRVLVKDQTTGAQNGIYVYSGGSNTFYRASDYDGTPSGEVTDGNIIPVTTGLTQYNTIWILVTPNPITIGVTPLEFTLFATPISLIGGVGITVSGNTISVIGASLAGNSIAWSGNTFNADISTGTLATALNSKLNVSTFNSYTGTTETRLQGIEADITYLSGQTDTKLDITDFNTYSGLTNTRITNIENDVDYISGVTDSHRSAVTGYTASTASNEIFLIHTGGTDINTVAVTAIDWHSVVVSGSSYSWTGGSDIKILNAGTYEVSYNIPFGHSGSNNIRGIGGNIVLNNSTILNNTATAGTTARSGVVGALSLPTVILTLAANDVLTLVGFRTGLAGISNTLQNGSILIKKKNTLQ